MTDTVITLEQYLHRRSNGHKAMTALTKREADIIGLPYPLTHGWPERHRGIILTPEQQALLKDAVRVYRVAKKDRREARKLEMYDKALKYGWKPPGRKISIPDGVDGLESIQKKQASKKFFSSSMEFVATDDFLESFEWRKVRMLALKKYGAKCMCCGATPATGAVINVDHIKPRKKFPELALNLDNLQILCHDCNHGKGNWDMTDWRGK